MPKIGHREHGVAQRARAVALREAGLTYARIGEQLGISRQTAYKHVQRALADLTKRTAEGADRVRQPELRRLDALLAANWAKRGEVAHARVILSISARRARLEGLDAPERQEISGMGGTPLLPPPEPELPGLENLTTAQLEQLQELLRIAGVEAPRASEVGLESVRPALPPCAPPRQLPPRRELP